MARAGVASIIGPWPDCTSTVALHDGTTVPDSSHDELAALDDRALVVACVAGRREAFDELVVRHRRAVYQLCHRFVGNHEDAADLAQDVFLRAYRALPQFKGDAAVGTWLHRIAVNVCLNKVGGRANRTEAIDERRPPALERRVRLQVRRGWWQPVARKPGLKKFPRGIGCRGWWPTAPWRIGC